MNLINLKKDIRYSLGDIKAERFTNERVVLSLSKVLKKLNQDFHLNRTTKFYKAIANKRTYYKPRDFYFLTSAYFNDIKLDKIYDTDEKVNINATTEDAVQHVVIDSGKYNEFVIQPMPTNPTLKIHLINSSSDTVFNADKIIDVRYDNGEAYVYYDKSSEEVVTTIDADYGIISFNYIAVLDIDMTADELSIPDSFYDVLHFKVVSDLLSDDNRTENINKSALYLQKYANALSDIQTDGRYKYTYADLLTDYRRGV